MPQFCAHCGTPIHYVSLAHGYVHDVPLGLYPVSRREAQDVHADPPRYRKELHRQTVLHPATAAGPSLHNPRRRKPAHEL